MPLYLGIQVGPLPRGPDTEGPTCGYRPGTGALKVLEIKVLASGPLPFPFCNAPYPRVGRGGVPLDGPLYLGIK